MGGEAESTTKFSIGQFLTLSAGQQLTLAFGIAVERIGHLDRVIRAESKV